MTIILSLGNIIETDFSLSIQAFQKIEDRLMPGRKVQELIPELISTFKDFNLGKLTEAEFQQQLIKVLLDEQQATELGSKEEFLRELQDAWNALCMVDEQAVTLIKSIINNYKRLGVNVVIYSDTNETNFKHIFKMVCDLEQSKTERLKLELFFEEIRTTFEYGMSKAELLKDLVNKAKPCDPCKLVFTSAENIANSFLKEMTEIRDKAILDVVDSTKATKIEIITLPKLRLTEESFSQLIPRKVTNKPVCRP